MTSSTHNVHQFLARQTSTLPLSQRPDAPSLRMLLKAPDGQSHVMTIRSTFAIRRDGINQEAAQSFHQHALGMAESLGLELQEIQILSASSMEMPLQ